jgi:hypothetical protein
MKNDKYSHARGGWSRILDVSCDHCESRVCFYQKDGPGPLKRMYVDRMIGIKPTDQEFICSTCQRVLGIKIIYEKEARPAYRLFQNSVKKKITTQAKAKQS